MEEASGWEEAKFLRDTGGMPVEKTLGLETHSENMPSQKTIQENLTLHGMGDTPLQFELPDPSRIPLFGVPDAKDLDEFFVFPPFLDLDGLLDPVFIPASKAIKGDLQPPNSLYSCAVDTKPISGSSETPTRVSPTTSSGSGESTPGCVPELFMQLQTPKLEDYLIHSRHNKSEQQEESEPMEQSEDAAVDSEPNVQYGTDSTPELIPSGSSSGKDHESTLSVEMVHSDDNDCSIIDLTQDC